ncbi:hypothetical protein ABPG72_020250 [Tetrahymena utriculariae]
MSDRNYSFSVSDDSENFQSKSIQGKLFDYNAFNNLQGDNEYIDRPSQNSFSISKERKLIDAQDLNYSLYLAQISDTRQKEVSLLDQNSAKIKASEIQLSFKQVLQVELSKSSSKQNLQEADKVQDQNQNNNSFQIENKNGSTEQNQNPRIDKCSKSKIIQIENNSQKQQTDKSIFNEKQNSKKMRQSIQNYQKAASIINKIISKSVNRVQRINQKVYTFITLLQLRISNRKMTSITKNQLQQLNDKAYFHNKIKKKQLFSSYIHKIYYFLERRNIMPVFMPTDTFRIYWDIFQISLTYTFTYIYSILMFFCSTQADTDFIKYFFTYAFILFTIDVFVILNTGYFNQDAIVLNRKQIILRYLKSHIFFTDTISLFVMGSKLIFKTQNLIYNPSQSFQNMFFNFLIFLKLNGTQQKANRFGLAFTLKEYQKHTLRLFNQLFTVISVAHTVSLAWYYLGMYQIQSGYSISWLQKYELIQLSYIDKYIYCMYWSITTMTTVGYGDITATNYVEALFIAICMIIFSCVFAYSINNIGFILQEIQKSSKQLNDNITTIQRQFLISLNHLILYINKRYLNRKNVNLSLKSRVRHYLSFLVEEQRDRNQQAENEILKLLSNKLRDEITVEINSRIIKNYQLFSNNFSDQTLRKLPFIMKEVLISPNEIIFEQEDYEDQSIYFIENGLVEIYQVSPPDFSGAKKYSNDQINVIKELKSYDLFGEISFFSGQTRKACARSINLSTLYKIERNEFITLIKENQEDFERFKMIEEQIKVQRDFSLLHLECYACKVVGHTASNCPRIHHVFDSQFQILKCNFSVFQNRNRANRKHTRRIKSNTLLMIKQNNEISTLLKGRIKYFNTYTELLFETNAENLSQYSLKTQHASDLEYQTDSDHTSLNQEQISQTSIITKFQNDLLNQSQTNNQKTYQKQKTIKMIKKSIAASKKDEGSKNSQSLKDLQSNEYSERKKNLNSYLNQNKNLFPVAISEKLIGQGESQLEYHKEQSKIYLEKDSELFLNQLCNYRQKSISKELEDNLNTISHQNFSKQQSFLSNSQEGYEQKRSKKKNLTNQANQNQINVNLNDNNHNPSYTQNEEVKTTQNKSNKQLLNSKKNTFQSSNDSKITYTIDQLLCNQSLKQFLEGNEANLSYEEFFFNFENYLKSQNISQFESIQLSDPKVINKMLFEYLFQNIQYSKKSNQSILLQKLYPSQKNASILQDQSMEFQNSLSFDQNISKSASNNVIYDQSNVSNQFQNIKQLQQSLQINENNQKNQQQEQQSENDNYMTKQVLYEKFEIMKNFRKFFPHNNFVNILSQQKLKKYNKFKKPKINSIRQKERRQNVIIKQDIARIFQFNQGIIQNNFQSLIDLDNYKPTYLSYGVSQKNDTVFPKQFANINSISFI